MTNSYVLSTIKELSRDQYGPTLSNKYIRKSPNVNGNFPLFYCEYCMKLLKSAYDSELVLPNAAMMVLISGI
jgi:hypothetical protein